MGRRDAPPLPPTAATPPPPSPRRPPLPASPPLVVAPAGFRLLTPAEVATCPALLGRTVLYYWSGDGWVRGTVARRSRAQGFSHVVRYGPRSALGAAMVDSLLDAASHGPAGRWVLLCPTRQRARCFSGTTLMPVGLRLSASTNGPMRHVSKTMEFASRTISPVPDTSRYEMPVGR